MAYKNIKSLQEAILKKAKGGMDKAVMPVARKQIQRSIEQVVYSVYEPIQYNRRGFGNGGLGDVNNINGTFIVESASGFEYQILNTTKPSSVEEPDVYLAPLVIMGQLEARASGYPLRYVNGSEDKPYGEPRGFMTHAKTRLNKDRLSQLLEAHMRR